jgi:transposase
MSEDARAVSANEFVDTGRPAKRRNKHWPEALKRQIVAETRLPGASVSVVARRHDVNANQVFKWRRQYEVLTGGQDEAWLVPVSVQPPPASTPASSRDGGPGGVIEIELTSGARVRISGAVDGVALRQVLERLR